MNGILLLIMKHQCQRRRAPNALFHTISLSFGYLLGTRGLPGILRPHGYWTVDSQVATLRKALQGDAPKNSRSKGHILKETKVYMMGNPNPPVNFLCFFVYKCQVSEMITSMGLRVCQRRATSAGASDSELLELSWLA